MLKHPSDFTTETRSAMRQGNGTVILEHIWNCGEELRSPTRMYSRIVLEPGCSIGWHVHQDEEEIFYFLSGEALFNDNGSEVEVGAGDVTATRSGEGHSVACLGNEKTEILATIIRYPESVAK